MKIARLRSIICILLLLPCYLINDAQVNLVLNPSFETYTSCPTGFDQIYVAVNWKQPTSGTSDCFSTCSPTTSLFNVGVPANWMGYQNPYSGGNCYAGIIAYQNQISNYREYIQGRLSSPLTPGQVYYLSFQISLSDSSTLSCDGMGAYLSQTPISLQPSVNFTFTPQVSNPAGQMLNDVINWQPVTGAFVAAGGEEYITIGNFMDNTGTTAMRRLPAKLIGDFSYYYIDEVCLSQNPQTCNLPIYVGINAHQADAVFLYYNQPMERLVFENKSGTFAVSVIDLFGNLVKTAALDASQGLDVSDLPAGCYMARVYESGHVYFKKFIR
jgi:hypothetical protein